MLKFFNPDEELPEAEENTIKNQKLDKVTEKYDHNYMNCIITCTHRKKFNSNIYILRIIKVGLFYTILLIIPSGLSTKDPYATVLNSRDKAYNDDADFRKKWYLLSMNMIYEQQLEKKKKNQPDGNLRLSSQTFS